METSKNCVNEHELRFQVIVGEQLYLLCQNRKNSLGEAQILLNMSDGTTLCITHVTHDLRPRNAYYTVKHYANEIDVAAKTYRATNNEKCSFVFPMLEQVKVGLDRYLNKLKDETGVEIL